MKGIYCWTNKNNGKKYVGQSVDIQRRKMQHIYSAGKYETKFSRALAKYGVGNFDFEIIELVEQEKLNEREGFWIRHYDTVQNGYNSVYVDESGNINNVVGELNPNTLMTDAEVLEIRNRVYVMNERQKEVYDDFSEKISYDSFWQLLRGVTWKSVDTSMITELKLYRDGESNGRAVLTDAEVLAIRTRIHIGGEEGLSVYQDYKNLISHSTFEKVVTGATWTHVDCSMIGVRKVQRAGVAKAKLTKEDVAQIRCDYENGVKTLEQIKEAYSYVIPKTIMRVIRYETWKNVEPVSTIPEA